MSFPEKEMIIRHEDIRDTDIIIEDRKLVAVGGTEATRVSNTARKASAYSKIIESFAGIIHQNKKTRGSAWNLDTLKMAADKFVSAVVKMRSFSRFIWFKQFPEQQYVLLTKEQTINKLVNDLLCQTRKLDALASAQAEEQQQPQFTQLRYGHSLILTVCSAAQSGISSYRSVLLLDQPPLKRLLSSPLTSGHTNTATPDDGIYERYEESPRERSLRLQLRHRYLAAVRTKRSVFEFSNALLSAWGLPEFGKKSKKKSVAPAAADQEAPVVFDRGLPPSLEVVNNVATTMHGRGSWRATERKAFLEALETYPLGDWKSITVLIPSRTFTQVSSYGRYLQRKFGDFPNDAIRNYLLQDDL